MAGDDTCDGPRYGDRGLDADEVLARTVVPGDARAGEGVRQPVGSVISALLPLAPAVAAPTISPRW